jgi:hypothetical protein
MRIAARLHRRMPNTNTTFPHFLLEVKVADIQKHFTASMSVQPPSHLLSHSKRQLERLVQEATRDPQLKLDFEEDEPRTGYLIRNVHNEVSLWRLLRNALLMLKHVDPLLSKQRPMFKGSFEDVQVALDTFAAAANWLSHLVTFSPCFWMLLHNDAILDTWQAMPKGLSSTVGSST